MEREKMLYIEVIREMQTKFTKEFYCIPLIMTKIKKTEDSKCFVCNSPKLETTQKSMGERIHILCYTHIIEYSINKNKCIINNCNNNHKIIMQSERNQAKNKTHCITL